MKNLITVLLLMLIINSSVAQEKKNDVVPQIIEDTEEPEETYVIPNEKFLEEQLNEAKLICNNNINREKRLQKTSVKSYNIVFSLYDLTYKKNKLFLFFDAKNRKKKNFNIDWIGFYKKTDPNDKSITSRENVIPTIYIHNEPTEFSGKKNYSFIAVIDRNLIDNRSGIIVSIKEKNTERELVLEIQDTVVSNGIEM